MPRRSCGRTLRAGSASAAPPSPPSRRRRPIESGSELVDEADVHAADGAAVDVVRGSECFREAGGAGRAEAGVGIVPDLVDDRVDDGVAPDVVVAGDAPAVGVLLVAGFRPDLPVEAADAQLRRDLVVGGDLVDLVKRERAGVGSGDEGAGVAERRGAVVENA